MKTFAEELQEAADKVRTRRGDIAPALADWLAAAATHAAHHFTVDSNALSVARAINDGPRTLHDRLTDLTIAALRPVELWHARRIARARARAQFDKGAVTTRRPL